MTRILVVEDEEGIALPLEDDLKAQGYEVEVIGDGEAALERVRQLSFDLILLDVMLPRSDGFQVCRELRRRDRQTPVIMLTARTGGTEKVLGLELGADDYVTKPYDPAELRARIKAVLRRTSGEPPEVRRFGDLELDFTRCELRRRGQVVDLAPLEFRLLAAFVRRAGRVLTRQQLLDEVWGADVFVTGRVVDNQVTKLRKKVEDFPAEPRHLVSVRGIGYRFDP